MFEGTLNKAKSCCHQIVIISFLLQGKEHILEENI